MNKSLSSLEARLQHFIEEGTSRLFSAKDIKTVLAARLVDRMLAEMQSSENGNLTAPHNYIIEVNEENSAEFESNTSLIKDLTTALINAASRAEIYLQKAPSIQFRASKKIPLGEFQIRSTALDDDLSNTQSLELPEQIGLSQIPFGAFLIADGTSVFPLTQNVVNIGRKNDNHLVLDNSHVSRRHAQLRAISGIYHFFDLASTAGSTINGQTVKNAALLSGDVISLAGVPLIYGQDSSAAEAETREVEVSKNLGSEKPTINLKPTG